MLLRNVMLLRIYNHINICNDVHEKYVVYCMTPNVPYVAKEYKYLSRITDKAT